MRHAIKLGLRDDNPADLLLVCLDVATPMTRLAIVTGLRSVQRIGDCVRMQCGWIENGITQFTQERVRRGGVTKDVAVPMHPFWIAELNRLPRRAVTPLYELTGSPFKTTAAVRERLRALMARPAVQEVHGNLVARETIKEDATSPSMACARTRAAATCSSGT